MENLKKRWKKILTVCGVLAFLAAVAYGIYYFFFAEDEEELDGDFFEEEEGSEESEEPEKEQADAETMD